MRKRRKITAAKTRPFSVLVLFIVLILQGLSAVYGGMALIWDPSGEFLQMSVRLLEPSPFTNYLIPGIILFGVLGIYPLVVSYLLWMKYRWAWLESMSVGIALLIWIAVEIQMVGYHAEPPLQLIYGITGVFIMMLSGLPSVKREAHS